MSLQILLSDYPNYSARKVRRLAKQLSMLDNLAEVRGVGSEGGLVRGISQDLVEYNMLSARLETQLGDVAHPDAESEVTERISVTPHSAAMRAINHLIDYVRVNSDVNLKGDDFQHAIHTARGYINGQTFSTDRTIIQARLSPQSDLPLDQGEGS